MTRAWAMGALVGLASCTCAAPVADVRPAVFVDLDPADGGLTEQLAEQVKRAEADERLAVVQVMADWCGPCRELRDHMDDPRMVAAFSGTHVARVDHGLWKNMLVTEVTDPVTGVWTVPAFYGVQRDGTLGARITGKAWGPNVPEEMAPPLRRFFDALRADVGP